MTTLMKQTKGLKRNTIDKFYTNDSAVNLCCSLINDKLSINSEDLIIEPSAGNGSFIEAIKLMSTNYKFYDLKPESPEIIEQDYLELNYQDIQSQFEKIHIIGNPPFGRQSSLAIKFIKKSCEFGNSVSFILPKSFKKESLKRAFPSSFHLIFEIDLPENSFLVEGKQHNVDTTFQIWEKKDSDREIIEKIKPVGFIFVKQDEAPDISFRRVGVYAGKIDKNIEKSIQSHYFIKFINNKTTDENLTNLKHIQFNHNNTVGPKSISKQELIKEFLKVL
jgi:predicted RNA methylase